MKSQTIYLKRINQCTIDFLYIRIEGEKVRTGGHTLRLSTNEQTDPWRNEYMLWHMDVPGYIERREILGYVIIPKEVIKWK